MLNWIFMKNMTLLPANLCLEMEGLHAKRYRVKVSAINSFK